MTTKVADGGREALKMRRFGRVRSEGGAVGFLAAAFCLMGVCAQPASAQSQSAETIERVKHAAVEVFTAKSENKKGDTPLSSGSGFFINRTGLCITNNHVVDPTHRKPRWEKQQLQYQVYNRLVWWVVVDAGTEEEKTYEAFVKYQNDLADQAILQVVNEDGRFLDTPHYLKLKPSDRVKVGDKAWTYGFPGGDDRKVGDAKHPVVAISDGHVVGIPRRTDGDIKMIDTDAMADPGNSGGAMVDVNGDVVGTVTLKLVAKYAGRPHQSSLVPADLTRDFIIFAFQRGKLDAGIDLEPFYTHLVGKDGFVDVAGLPRQPSTDCIFMEDGNRVCGAPSSALIELPTPLGKLTLPCDQMAYLLEQDDEYGIILMDGGQRLPFLRDDAVLRFTPTGAAPIEQDLSEVRAVAFRKDGALPDPPRGENVLLGGDTYHLMLTDVRGKVKFSSNLGVQMERTLDSISTITTNEAGEQVVSFRDGSKVIGEFDTHEFSGVLAVSGTPQTLTLEGVRDLTVDVIDCDKRRKRMLTLADLFVPASSDLLEIAKQLDEGDTTGVAKKLAAQMNPSTFNRLGELKKDQLRTLDATCAWVSGDLARAKRTYRKLKSSGDDGLKWFAAARLEVLDRYPDGMVDGKPLTDPKIYKLASEMMTRDILGRAKEILRERQSPAPESRGLFMRTQKNIQTVSDELMIASQLGSKVADTAVVWLWSWQMDVLYDELRRLSLEKEAKQEELQGLSGNARDYSGRRLAKEIEKLDQALETTEEWLNAAVARVGDVGFIIDDPDLDLLD